MSAQGTVRVRGRRKPPPFFSGLAVLWGLLAASAAVQAQVLPDPYLLLGRIAGIPILADSVAHRGSPLESPARWAGTGEAFVAAGGVWDEISHSFRGDPTDLGRGGLSLELNRPGAAGPAGLWVSLATGGTALDWSLAGDRVTAVSSQRRGGGAAALYGIVRGVKLGGAAGGIVGPDGFRAAGAIEAAGDLPAGIGGRVRFRSVPADGTLGLRYKGGASDLDYRIRREDMEASLSRRGPAGTLVTLNAFSSAFVTPSSHRGGSRGHAQVWDSDVDGWEVRASLPPVRAVTLEPWYGSDRLAGNTGLWYAGEQYLRGMLDAKRRHYGIELRFGGAPAFVPAFRFGRAVTEMDLSHGIADSWPFTPPEIEIIGDKTWTTSGTGEITADSGTLAWRLPGGTALTGSFFRAYPAWRLRITTRDHLSTDPMDMLFGRTRIERDGIIRADVCALMLFHERTWGRLALSFGIQQFIPLGTVKEGVGTDGPEPPQPPEFRLSRPERYGGLAGWSQVRWRL